MASPPASVPVAARPARAPPVPTGSTVLDDGLGGGLPAGSLLLVSGEAGAGSVEFCLGALHSASREGLRAARFASALRSPARVQREADALFPEGHRIAAVPLPVPLDAARCLVLANEMGRGDVLALESLAALAQAGADDDLVTLLRELAETAERSQGVVLLLHAPGAVPEALEARVSEAVDGTFRFLWRDGGTMRRRFLSIGRLRGLAPLLETEEVPIFEVGLRKGTGFAISRVKSVL